jgi:pectin methylesterase-like acyl-CoA thioesterase
MRPGIPGHRSCTHRAVSLGVLATALVAGGLAAGCGSSGPGQTNVVVSGSGGQSGNGGSGSGGSGSGGAASGGSPGNTGSGGAGASGSGGAGNGGSTGADAGSDARGTGGTPGTGGAGGQGGRGGSGGVVGTGGVGAGGAVGTGGTPGPVILPGTTVTGLFPKPGAQGLCADPALRITFNGVPTLGAAGRIQVFDAAQTGTAAAVVDMAVAMTSATIGGAPIVVPRPVYIDGNTVTISLLPRALAFGKTYYVTVDAGAVVGPGASALSITGTTTWRFSTAAAAPTNVTASTVAADGTGNFCSVQGALDALPANNNAAARVTINAGNYHEIVHFTAKSNVTLHGQDRNLSVIAAINNNTLNPNSSARALVGIDNSTGLIIEDLTISNLTPLGGSQAEALRLSGCTRCVIRDSNIFSQQDTVQLSGVIYVNNSLIAGNVDFMWGNGVVYFNNCELRTVSRVGYNVQARNAAGAFGYVFVDSRLTADAGLAARGYLARTDSNDLMPASQVSYINCQLGSHVAPAGWLLSNAAAATTNLRFEEYQSVDPSGNPIDTSARVLGRQLTPAEATMRRTPTLVLGGWQPPP